MTITVELNASPTLLEALRLLAGFANPVASPHPTAKSITPPKAKQEKKSVEESKDAAETDRCAPVESTTAAPASVTPVLDEPTSTVHAESSIPPTDLTIEQLRAITGVKTKSGKKAEVIALLSKYGSDSVTHLDAAHYAAYYAEVVAL